MEERAVPRASLSASVTGEAPVIFSNGASIVFSSEDVAFLFGVRDPEAPGEVHTMARVYLTPAHAKRFCYALQQQLARFEDVFGQIDPDPVGSLPEEKRRAIENE